MADEAVALEEMEEVDVISLLATQSEEEGDELDDEYEDGVDESVLKERLSKRNKSLKKSKQAIHRMQDENDALQRRLDEIESKLNSAKPDTEANKQEQKEALEQWRTEISDNPEKAVDFSNWQMSQLQDNVVNYIADMKKAFDEQLNELKGATNPERLKYEGEVNKLRANPAFANLDDDTLLTVVKGLKSAKAPRGSVGGKRATVEAEEFKMTDEIRRQMGFGA